MRRSDWPNKGPPQASYGFPVGPGKALHRAILQERMVIDSPTKCLYGLTLAGLWEALVDLLYALGMIMRNFINQLISIS